jgi:hypothetical protein
MVTILNEIGCPIGRTGLEIGEKGKEWAMVFN